MRGRPAETSGVAPGPSACKLAALSSTRCARSRGRNALRSRRRLRNLVVVMVCSFCNGGGPPYGNHNVRTCKVLQVATLTFIAQKGKSLTFKAFKKAARVAAETVLLATEIGATVITCRGAAPVA